MGLHQKIKIFCVGLVVFAIIFFALLFSPVRIFEKAPKALSDDEYQIWKGSHFKAFQGKVYITVAGNGDYEIENADVSTLQPLDHHDTAMQMAKDKNHVYCGNLILPDLNVHKLKWLGSGYVTDGVVSYYCGGITERNPNINIVVKFFQIILHELGLAKKPQIYWYPFIQLKSANTPYRLIADNIASNGTYTYKDGKLTDSININKPIQYLPLYLEDSENVRVDDNYYANGDQVFYQTKRLDLSANPALKVHRYGNAYYLNDPDTGQFYFEDQKFPSENLPYQILSRLDDHSDHLIFESPKGLFAVDQKTKQLTRLGDNPFTQGKALIAPDVWVSGDSTYYLGIFKKITKSKNGDRPCFEASRLYRLKNTTERDWHKISDVKNDRWVHGSLWKKGQQYFYFDRLGKGQGFDQTIYEVVDHATVLKLNQMVKGRELADLLHDGKLKPLLAENYLQIKQVERLCF